MNESTPAKWLYSERVSLYSGVAANYNIVPHIYRTEIIPISKRTEPFNLHIYCWLARLRLARYTPTQVNSIRFKRQGFFQTKSDFFALPTPPLPEYQQLRRDNVFDLTLEYHPYSAAINANSPFGNSFQVTLLI